MTGNITVEDFIEWIEYHLNGVEKKTQQEIGSIKAEAARRGMFKSSVAAKQVIQCGKDRMKEAAAKVVGEFQRIKATGALSQDQLLLALSTSTRAFAERLEDIVREAARNSVGKNLTAYEPSIAEIKEEAEFALKHARTGLMEPPEPPVPPSMANKINIQTMTGGAVQQGTVASTQHVSIAIDTEAARAAIARLEEAIQGDPPDSAALASMRGDIETIKAQITKPEPSQSILLEAWHSLRRIGETATATQIPAAIVSLGRALGLT